MDGSAPVFYLKLTGRIVFFALQKIVSGNRLNVLFNQASLPNFIGNDPSHHQDSDFSFESVSCLQKTGYRISGRKCFCVEETHSIAQGDFAYAILANKTPVS